MEIHWRHAHSIPPERQLEVEEQLERLAHGHRDLIDVWIDIDKSQHHRTGQDRVKIRCMARDVELVAEGHGDDPDDALRDALKDFEREVKRRRERLEDRHKQRLPEPPRLGVVDRLFPDDGYGFIVTQDGEQVYFHRNALNGGLRLDALEVGQRVALDVEPGERGPQATFVSPPPLGTPG